MFHAMRSKFYKKCKSSLKLSKTRLETVKKKKSVVYTYLKNDLAELLRKGLDLNAYGRVEGFLAEKNMTFCYEYLEQCISTIYSNLSNMENQRECPSECREAVATLMHAAARFADLPEVRELRTVFTERFGSSLESFVSKEFVAKLNPEHPSQERKIQILEEVAQELSILWDPRSLRKQLFKPAPAAQSKPVRGAVHDSSNDGYNKHKKKDDALQVRESHDSEKKMSDVRVQDVPSSNRRKDSDYDGYNQHKKNSDGLLVTDSRNGDKKMSDERGANVRTSNTRKDTLYERYNVPSGSEDEALSNHRRGDSSTSQDSQRTGFSSAGSFSEDEVDSRKPVNNGLIPPYVEHSNAKGGNNVMEPTRSHYNLNAQQYKYKDPPYTKSNLKPPPGREMAGNGVARKVSPRLQAMLNDGGDVRDEEEKKIDQLLMHYSKKKTPGQESDDTYGATRHKNTRTDPLGNQYEETDGVVRHINAKSEPAAAGHVHPKLPDYDDLAARLAALRGR